ncbi:hypothetical protein TNCV_3393291 [Trichonephila clavipes]|nr:hypothetical protein TNCV_3393291 [Trichonephila clavipes]
MLRVFQQIGRHNYGDAASENDIQPIWPFYRVLDYFLRIEFQHRGSPHAPVLRWFENDPHENLLKNMPKTIQL